MMAVPRAGVGAVRLDAQKELGDEAVEDRSAHTPVDAAESLDLVERELEARHLEVFGANTFTRFVDRSHDPIVRAARRKTNGHFCTRAHMSDQRGPSARRFVQPHARGGAATAQVVVFIASATLFAAGAAGCVSRERMNAACAWTNDPPRALDLRRAADRRHLDRDAETAEELAIRYADAARGHRSGHFAGDAEYAGARERCMATLVDAAA